MDQAASANQGILWAERERSEDSDLIAVSVYVLVAIVRKRLRLDASLYQILQILSLSLLKKCPFYRHFSHPTPNPEFPDPRKQLILFDFIAGQQ